MIKKILYNPNFIYIFSFIVPFIFYSFEWSTLYPSLSLSLFLFYIFTFIACLVTGVAINLTRPFKYKAIEESNGNIGVIAIIYVMYTAELLYSGTLPIYALLQGNFNYAEDAFGLPVIHTFLVSFNTFYAIFLFHQYISTRKRKLLWMFLIVLLPFILLVYRSSILNILLGALIVFLFNKPVIPLRLILKTVAGVIFVFFMFGFMGNLRSGKGDDTFIPRSSGATDKFLNSYIPKEFYWSYLYVASPVANLQNNINLVKTPEGNYRDLLVNEFLPAFVTKFFIAPEEKKFHQINGWLNVGTIYVYSFSYLRWQGIILMFFYFLAIINLYYLLIQKSDTYKVTGMAILFNMIIFANFHNTISYSASSLQLIYPVIFSMIAFLIKQHKIKSDAANKLIKE
jgi:oligosaccharide repeat unit polymerase